MAPEYDHLSHLLVVERSTDEEFRRRGGGEPRVRPVEDRAAHGAGRLAELQAALASGTEARDELLTEDELRALGAIVTLEGADAAFPLRIDSLNRLSAHRKSPKRPRWLLLSVLPPDPESGRPERATVWVSDEYRNAFVQLFEKYLRSETPTGRPSNNELVANIAHIRSTVLDDLWQSDGEPPQAGRAWWEVWLRPTSNGLELLHRYAQDVGLAVSPRVLRFPDRHVVWVEGQWTQLTALPFTAVPIAEIRRPEFVDTIEDLSQDEQAEYVDDLAERLQPADDLAPTVCHLDTGVARTHVLLAESLSPQDLHTVIGNSGFDRHGHGTSMAGLALLGDVDRHLAGSHTVPLAHRLESVRIRPERGEQLVQPVAYGDVTAQAISLPEAVNVGRRRVFCMPVTATGDTPSQPGQPTLWSATIDALAVGTSVTRSGTELSLLGPPDPDARRLFIVSAGNVDQYAVDHLGTSDLSAAQDPAQAWNVLTVGALTELDTVPTDPAYAGWGTVAPTGELSPHSRTSVVFGRSWPIKPDIVMEGGNVLHDGGSMFETCHPALALRTTGHANDKAVTAANATSAATAQAARLAAVTTAAYPEYWPETVRALLVHAAEWTPAMRQQLTAARTAGRREQQTMLRRYGWGVPTEDRVLYSTSQAVTLVIQDEFVPFVGDEFRCPAFRLHNLPWPREALQDLGATPVTLRVTLSYFVEPTASRRGWRRRYAYPSHQLRFDLQGPLESEDEFVQRVNRDRRDEEESGRPTGSQVPWLVGSNQRNLGSLHQDIWDTTGVELARSGRLAIYPVGGWWKNNGTPNRIDQPVRYALVVSLRTTETDVDLYTPIATLLNVPTSIPIE